MTKSKTSLLLILTIITTQPLEKKPKNSKIVKNKDKNQSHWRNSLSSKELSLAFHADAYIKSFFARILFWVTNHILLCQAP